MAFNLAHFPEAFALPQYLSTSSAWHELLPVAPILMRLLRPRSFVELGTHAGDSYLAFCSAVHSLGLETRCAAVDTWRGDIHTGAYGPEVFQAVQAANRPFEGFSRLLQTTFDEAAGSFAEGSVDLLHIDGAHAYEAVAHDFHTWLPKMRAGGVVLFHDTAERTAGFGVWKLWEEARRNRMSAEIPFGHGLGILALSADMPVAFVEFIAELNGNPNLLNALQSLGDHVRILRKFGDSAYSLHTCQSIANDWRQRTAQAIRNPTPNLAAALTDGKFGPMTVQDVHQLAQDAVNLATEVAQLRQKVNVP